MSGAAASSTAFAARTILILVALVTVGFLSFLLLFAYADDLRPARGDGTHALSTSAVGFAGIAALVKDVRGDMRLIRREADFDTEALLVLTPGSGTDPGAVKRILDRREGRPTLVILPKWITMPMPDKPNWVRIFRPLSAEQASNPLPDSIKLTIETPRNGLRTISGTDVVPIFDGPGGKPLVVSIADEWPAIAADPDLFDNQGLATLEGAQRAIQILDLLDVDKKGVAFDLTLHGYGRNPNLLKLAFEAPFLPLTLCVLIAALVAGWHAMLRFGPAAVPQRGLAFGKRALADNGAALLRLAGRRHRTGERYAALVRDAAAAGTGAPPGQQGQALDRYLDRLEADGEPYSSLAARAADAPDTRRLLDAARALYHWKRTVTREHR
jgi:hypothetical protein